MCLIVPYYYKKFEDEIFCIMKTEGPYMKVVLLNEVVKHPLFKPNFNIEMFFTHFRFFNKYFYFFLFLKPYNRCITTRLNDGIKLPII
jgi:hypothetical protein